MSNTYEQFAYFYDQLMEEAPYDEWVTFVLKRLSNQPQAQIELLELGAGTGTLAELLIKKGYRVTVSDYSEEMLTIADQKLRSLDASISLVQLDMRAFHLETVFDAVLIFCDSLNYLSNEDEVLATFQNAFNHLKPGGYLLFDVHSTYKISRFIDQQTFGSSDPEISYLWECFEGDAPHSVIHDLTFFVETESGLYQRSEETHEQRTYPISVLLDRLQKAGFEEPEILGDFNPENGLETSERWVFAVKRPLEKRG